jgi:restriction system protein
MARRRRRSSSGGAGLLILVLALVVVAVLVRVLSSPITWIILVPLATAGLWARRRVTRRRAAEALERRQQELFDQSCLAAADVMSGTQFEAYVAELLRIDGHQGVQLVGGPGDGGADILSAEPSGRLVAVQCKRQMAPVPVGVVRQLNGTLAHEHPGRSGVLVTTALLTRPAANLAAQSGITVVDRNGLAQWMGQARQSITAQQPWQPDDSYSASAGPAPWPQPPAPSALTPPDTGGALRAGGRRA